MHFVRVAGVAGHVCGVDPAHDGRVMVAHNRRYGPFAQNPEHPDRIIAITDQIARANDLLRAVSRRIRQNPLKSCRIRVDIR